MMIDVMDAVVTFVNGLDPVWQAQYAKTVGGKALAKRFRDWGILKYWMRGVERHMPFIENVFLVVSGPTQVPEWASLKLKIVCHEDIIPKEYLPTFNSGDIELFLHRIPGLSEQFIYFNDDMHPMMDCRVEDFFEGGKVKIKFRKQLFYGSLHKVRSRNGDLYARKALGMKPGLFYVRPQHSCSPMLKSENEKVFEASWPELKKHLAPVRTPEGVNQYIYHDYLYYKGLTTPVGRNYKHISLAVWSGKRVADYIAAPSLPFACINDVDMTEERFQEDRALIIEAFEKRYPDKSRFEK